MFNVSVSLLLWKRASSLSHSLTVPKIWVSVWCVVWKFIHRWLALDNQNVCLYVRVYVLLSPQHTPLRVLHSHCPSSVPETQPTPVTFSERNRQASHWESKLNSYQYFFFYSMSHWRSKRRGTLNNNNTLGERESIQTKKKRIVEKSVKSTPG